MTSPRILIVDDEPDLRELLEITLVKMGLDVDSAESLADARRFLGDRDYSLVITDMRLGDGLGIELVQEVTASKANLPIAVITAFGSAENAVAALKAGAFDYLAKPVSVDQLRLMVRSALRLPDPGGRPGSAAVDAEVPLRLIGESAGMRHVREQIVRLARSMAPVAITGESGSGKELAARDIHALSTRSAKPFVAVNCGAIPEALMEAEFFGYRKGAFTGAEQDREGFFQAANGGTLMLDEVADLPLAMQVKLLRAIQERRVRKIGSTVEEPVDVRLISATHQNLMECVEKGTFRQDLYYRLHVIELVLPPLRQRLDDIGLLSEAILERLTAHGARTRMSDEAMEALRQYRFPGNVRELENILERALAFSSDGVIRPNDLALKPAHATPGDEPVSGGAAGKPSTADAGTLAPPFEARMPESGLPVRSERAEAAPAIADDGLPRSLPDHLDEIERGIITKALAKTRFNRTQAAELLGISFRQLRYRMQRLSIREPE